MHVPGCGRRLDYNAPLREPLSGSVDGQRLPRENSPGSVAVAESIRARGRRWEVRRASTCFGVPRRARPKAIARSSPPGSLAVGESVRPRGRSWEARGASACFDVPRRQRPRALNTQPDDRPRSDPSQGQGTRAAHQIEDRRHRTRPSARIVAGPRGALSRRAGGRPARPSGSRSCLSLSRLPFRAGRIAGPAPVGGRACRSGRDH